MGGQRGRLISVSDRENAIMLIEIAILSGASQAKACEELEISTRTYQRWTNTSTPNEDQRPHAKRPEPSNKLSLEEEQLILKTCNEPKFQSQPPSQIVPILADANIYIGSESTIYRVLKKYSQQHHRGKSKKPCTRPLSTHCAKAPNEVWMWDITWLQGPAKGIYYYLYLMLDLFSRKVVGWEIWQEESAENASVLIRRAVMSEKCSHKLNPLVLHSDNGSPMKGATMLETLYSIGVIPSRSRPRVSNDNPYAESIFRTCKYRPDYPIKGFENLDSAREWVLKFVKWYNMNHRHSGLKFLTPNQRHTGKANEIFANRKLVYEAARLKNPKRWSRNIRAWCLDDEVWLNPEKKTQEIIEKNQTA